MGREARCAVQVHGNDHVERAGEARVHLDTDELVVSGPAHSGLRVRVPRAGIREVDADGGVVHVRWDDGTLALHLGPLATAWADALREPPKPVIDKLGVKAGMTVSAVGVHDDALVAQIRARAAALSIGTLAPASHVILLGVETPADLDAIATATGSLRPDGALWVLHPRGVRDVADTVIFDAGKSAGLVATKVARINATHTGEMLVRPKDRRG
jgi:hypothetical protein